MNSRPQNFGIIACDAFSDELSSIAAKKNVNKTNTDTPWSRLAWLEMGLHDHPESLRSEVQALIDAWNSDSSFSTILLAYGMCGNGLIGIKSRSKTLVLPRAHDCITILLGSLEAHETILKENPGTYFYSPGWIRGRRTPGPDRERHLRNFYAQRYPDDPDLVDDLVEADLMAFSHHNCAAYVDITNNQEAENYCRNCAAYLGWKFRKLQGNSRWLEQLLTGEWSKDKFLLVPPGHLIQRTTNETLIETIPCNEMR